MVTVPGICGDPQANPVAQFCDPEWVKGSVFCIKGIRASDSHRNIFSNTVSNSWIYSDLYVYQRCRIQR